MRELKNNMLEDSEIETTVTQKITAIKPLTHASHASDPSAVRQQPVQTSHTHVQEARVPHQEMRLPTVVDTPRPLPPLSPLSSPSPFPDTISREPMIRLKEIARPKGQALKGRDRANARMLEKQCRQLCLSLFFREVEPIRSLGFTSSVDGEGKSF